MPVPGYNIPRIVIIIDYTPLVIDVQFERAALLYLKRAVDNNAAGTVCCKVSCGSYGDVAHGKRIAPLHEYIGADGLVLVGVCAVARLGGSRNGGKEGEQDRHCLSQKTVLFHKAIGSYFHKTK